MKISTMLWPLMRRHRLLCLSMIIAAALGVAMLCALTGTAYSLERALVQYVDDYGYADAIISVYAVSADDAASVISPLSGVESFALRAGAETKIKTPAGEVVAARCTSDSSDDFTEFYFREGAMPQNDKNQILLEVNFADDYQIAVGDKLEISLGKEYEEYSVAGIVSAPETLATYSSGSGHASVDFGQLYFSHSLLEGTPFADVYTEIQLRINDTAEADAVLKRVNNALEEQGIIVLDSYTRADSPVTTRIDENLRPMQELCTTVPLVFYLTVLLVMFLCISVLIRQSRHDIAVLRALGFQVGNIRMLYGMLALFITLIGSGLGLLLARLVLNICLVQYEGFFPIPQSQAHFMPCGAELAVGLMIVTGQISALLGSSILSGIRPAEAFYRQVDPLAKTPLPVRTIFKNASPIIKFNLTTMLRNRKRMAFGIISCGAAVLILFATVSFLSSKNSVMHELFDTRIRYDVSVLLSEEPGGDELAGFMTAAAVDETESFLLYQCAASYGERSAELTVFAVDADYSLFYIPDVEQLSETGIVLDHYHAEQLGVSVGDSIIIENNELKVAAVSRQSANRSCYISRQQASALERADYYGLFCTGEDEQLLREKSMELSGFVSAATASATEKAMTKIYRVYDFAITVLILFAVAIDAMLLLIINRTNMIERRRELCILRTLGFSISSLSFNWMIQSVILLVCSLIVGIPPGVYFAKWLLKRLESADHSYFFVSGMAEVLLTFFILTVVCVIAHFLSVREMRRWQLVEQLKTED